MSGIQKREVCELLRLAFLTFCIPLTWFLCLGWDGQAALAGHDALTMHLPILHDFVKQGAVVENLLYRPQLIGGARVLDAGLLYPLFIFWAKIGFGAIAVLNLTFISIQIVFGFLAWHTVTSLTRLLGAGGGDDGWKTSETIGNLGMAWLLAFAPEIGWRLGHGHYNLILGLLPFLSAATLVAAWFSGRLSFTVLVTAGIAVALGIPTAGQQSVFYSALFGGPLLVIAVIHGVRSYRPPLVLAGAAALMLIAGVGWSLPRFAGLLDQAFSGDAGRSVGGPSLLYSFQVFSADDLVRSLFWFFDGSLPKKTTELLHDFNLPLGPLLLLLALLPFRRLKGLVVATAIAFLVALTISLNLAPLSTALAAVVPMLTSFRCPHRSLMIFSLALPIVTAALWLARTPTKKPPPLAVGIGAVTLAIVILLLPFALNEWLGILLCAGLLAVALGKFPTIRAWGSAPALLLLGALSLAAFKQRQTAPPPLPPMLAQLEALSADLRRFNPALISPLTRSQWDYRLTPFGLNEAYLGGASSLNGYWYPPRRVLELNSALESKPLPAVSVGFSVVSDAARYPVFAWLYNIQTGMQETGESNRPLRWTRLAATPGAAYFAARSQSVENVGALAKALTYAAGRMEEARTLWWLVGESPRDSRLDYPLPKACATASVQKLESFLNGQRTEVAVTTAADCPLVFATNYAGNLTARAIDPIGEKELTVFPANGPLVATWVPAGTTQVILEARPVKRIWASVGYGLGWIAFLASLALFYRWRKA